MDLEKRFKCITNEFRITLISDPTDEFPSNQNNQFRVRLPSLLQLPGENWKASLWGLSVADEGHSEKIISSKAETELVGYRYKLTQRYQEVDNSWLVEFKAKDKVVTLKEVMGKDLPVTSGVQLWHNIIPHMEQIVMEDVSTSSIAWKTAKNNAATVSLKTTWKPTFEWKQDLLNVKAVPQQDVFVRDASYRVQPLSSFAIPLEFAQQFGLITKDKNEKYHLGPNLEYELPKVTYSSSTPPNRTNQRYQWLGDDFVGIKPRDLLGDNELFKVMNRGAGGLFVRLTRFVQWRFLNLNAIFNAYVGAEKQTLMVYCDVIESTVVGAQKHPLLRKVQLERRGQGRATVKPIHHEWINLRSNRVEIIEVQIATLDGPLVVLPTGKTLVTMGFRRV